MQINLIYDSSTQSAPAGFFTAMAYAAQYLDSIITNPITVNIQVGWGEIGGNPIQSGVDAVGEQSTFPVVSYSQLLGYLTANASSPADAIALAHLPKTDPTNGKGFWISSAEQKAWGLIPANGTAIDGEVGFDGIFPLNFDPNNQAVPGKLNFISIAEHELTHALGRESGLQLGWSLFTTMDLFQYSAPGVIQTARGQPAYFSIDGGVTNLNNFDTAYDAGDWTSTVKNDSFGYEAYGAVNPVTLTDIALMNVLGFKVATQPGATVSSVTVNTDHSSSEVGIGHVVTITLNTTAAETVTGTPTLQLNDNEVATYVSGSGTNALQFTYTVQPGDNVSDLQATGLNLPSGATIQDVLGNSLSSNLTADLGVHVTTLVTNLQSSEDHLVYLLYQAAFARVPDYAGFEYWAGQADARNLSALQLADAFIAAPEFTAKFGANPTNDAYVTELYTNVLGRAPDQGGLTYWEGQANGGMARDQLLVAFATSAENLQTTAPHTTNGYWVT